MNRFRDFEFMNTVYLYTIHFFFGGKKFLQSVGFEEKGTLLTPVPVHAKKCNAMHTRHEWYIGDV